MNFGQSESKASQYSGLRGTDSFNAQANRASSAGQIAEDTTAGIAADPLRFHGQTGQDLFGSGKYGLGFNVDPAVESMIKQSYGLASAADASAGRLTPEGASAAAGSAITNILPNLIPQMMQFGQWQFNLPMNLNTYAANVANQNVNAQQSLLGGQGSSKALSMDFGFLQGGSGASTSSGASKIVSS